MGDRSRGWDFAHGSLLDRRLMAEGLIYFMHLHGSERDFTPIPSELTSAITEAAVAADSARVAEIEINDDVLSKGRRDRIAWQSRILAEEITPENLPRMIELSNLLLAEINSSVESHIISSRPSRHDPPSLKTLQQGLATDKLIKSWVEMESCIIGFLNDYLEDMPGAKGHSAEARQWMVAQWLGEESRIDLFSPMTGTDRSLLDLLPFDLPDGERLGHFLSDSLDRAVDNGESPLFYLAESYDRNLLECVPMFFGLHRVPDPTAAIMWAHRQSSIFLDDMGELPSSDRVLEALQPFLVTYRDAVQLELEEGGAPSIDTMRLSLHVLTHVALDEGKDPDSFLHNVSDSTLPGRKLRLHAMLNLRDDEIGEFEAIELAAQTLEFPPAERLDLLLHIQDTARPKHDKPPAVLESFVREHKEASVDYLRELLSQSDMLTKAALLRSFGLGLFLVGRRDKQVDPELRQTMVEFVRLAATHAPNIPPPTLDNLGDIMNEILGLNDLKPGDYLEDARIMALICAERYDGDLKKMRQEERAFSTISVDCFCVMVEKAARAPTPQDALAVLREWYEVLPWTFDYELNRKVIAKVLPQIRSGEDILAVSLLVPGADLRARLTQYATEKLAEESDFEGLSRVVLEDPYNRVPLISPAGEALCENGTRSGEQLEYVNSRIVSRTLESVERSAGYGTLLDGLLHNSVMDSERFLLAGLSSSSDETDLLGFLAEKWWGAFEGQFLESVHSTEYFDDDPKAFDEWANEPLPHFQVPTWGTANVRRVAEKLYSASIPARAFIVKKLLTGPDGVLHSKARTFRLISTFIDQYVDMEPEYKEEALKVVKALIEEATVEELYFRIAPFITRAAFQRPPKRRDAAEFVRETGIVDANFPDDKGMAREDSDYTRRQQKLRKLAEAKLKTLMFGGARTKKRSSSHSIAEILPEKYQTPETFERMDGITAIRMLLGIEGQLGARAAQIIPQCVDVPESLAAAFEGVYDQQKGQARPEAYRCVSRLAPDLVRPADSMSERIGGGSLATVYALSRVAEPDRVVKVLNPNAELRVHQSCDLWSRVLARLERENPGNAIYRFFSDQVLGELEGWLSGDINDTRFHELDAPFRERWQGYRVGKCSMVVPKSERVEEVAGPEHILDESLADKHVKIDEWIDGHNLTALRIGEQSNPREGVLTRAEMKNVLQILFHNYLEQLATGVVHANPHPGNYRVLPERDAKGNLQVAQLDRNFYQEFSREEVKAMTKVRLSGDPVKVITSNIVDAVLVSPENSELSESTRSEARKFAASFSFEDLSSINEFMRSLRQMGVNVPLRYSLFVLGINAFEQMCKDKGFEEGIAGVMDKGELLKMLIKRK